MEVKGKVCLFFSQKQMMTARNFTPFANAKTQLMPKSTLQARGLDKNGLSFVFENSGQILLDFLTSS